MEYEEEKATLLARLEKMNALVALAISEKKKVDAELAELKNQSKENDE